MRRLKKDDPTGEASVSLEYSQAVTRIVSNKKDLGVTITEKSLVAEICRTVKNVTPRPARKPVHPSHKPATEELD